MSCMAWPMMYQRLMSHVWMSFDSHIYESCPTPAGIMSHIWMSHVSHLNDSRLAYESIIEWLRLVGSLKVQVSLAEYRLFYRALLQKRPIISRSLLVLAAPYVLDGMAHITNEQVMSHVWMSHVWHTKDSYLIFGWLMCHTHEWRTDESCRTHEGLASHTSTSHVSRMNESCLTHK